MSLNKSQISILIVDDDAMGRNLLEQRLGREDFNVETADCGAAAIERMDVEHFDVILLDLMMPGISGNEVLEYIRCSAHIANPVVIILTGDSDRERVSRCLLTGADDYIVKPYDFLLLKARIWRGLKGRSIKNRGKLPDNAVLNGKRVLVVDDNESNRDILSRRCQKFGCEVETAETGEQALRLWSEKSFAIVLLDIHMPGMNGIEVLKTIRARPGSADTSVIMVSAEDNPDVIGECLTAGASDYISKPFNAVIVRARMQSCLTMGLKS